MPVLNCLDTDFLSMVNNCPQSFKEVYTPSFISIMQDDRFGAAMKQVHKIYVLLYGSQRQENPSFGCPKCPKETLLKFTTCPLHFNMVDTPLIYTIKTTMMTSRGNTPHWEAPKFTSSSDQTNG